MMDPRQRDYHCRRLLHYAWFPMRVVKGAWLDSATPEQLAARERRLEASQPKVKPDGE